MPKNTLVSKRDARALVDGACPECCGQGVICTLNGGLCTPDVCPTCKGIGTLKTEDLKAYQDKEKADKAAEALTAYKGAV